MIDIDDIPTELHPALNRMASEIATALGRGYPSEYNFSKSKNPKAIEIYQLAIVSLRALNEFCMDGYGIGLADFVGLIDQEECEDTEVEEAICII
jgi:hypothetical protein